MNKLKAELSPVVLGLNERIVDEVVVEILRALYKREWQVPDIEIRPQVKSAFINQPETIYSWELKFRLDFRGALRIPYSELDSLFWPKWGLSRIRFPGKELVLTPPCGPTLHLYTGQCWDRDARAWFGDEVRCRRDENECEMPFATFVGTWDDRRGNRFHQGSHFGELSPIAQVMELEAGSSTSQNKGSAKSGYSTLSVLYETAAWLRANVLSAINGRT